MTESSHACRQGKLSPIKSPKNIAAMAIALCPPSFFGMRARKLVGTCGGSAREVIERTAAVEAATHSSDAPSQWKLLNNLSPELREKRMKALDAEAVLTDAVSKSLDRE